MQLTNQERETIICYNEADKTATVFSYNRRMLRDLDKLATERPDADKRKSDAENIPAGAHRPTGRSCGRIREFGRTAQFSRLGDSRAYQSGEGKPLDPAVRGKGEQVMITASRAIVAIWLIAIFVIWAIVYVWTR